MISSNCEVGSAKCEVRGPSVVREGLQVKTEMANDEARMTKEARIPNAETLLHQAFVIDSSLGLCHSSLSGEVTLVIPSRAVEHRSLFVIRSLWVCYTARRCLHGS